MSWRALGLWGLSLIGLAVGPRPALAPQEAPDSIASCTNTGKGGTPTAPANCMCDMKCTDDNPHGWSENKKLRCKTYCKRERCDCKPPCP